MDSENSSILQPYLKNLSSDVEYVQKSAARDLLNYVTNRFLEFTQDHVVSLLRELGNLLVSQNMYRKKGGVYAAVVLLRLDVSPTQKSLINARIRNFFIGLLVQEDSMQQLVSSAIGYISRSEVRGANTVGGQFWSTAIDWLGTKGQIDVKRIASLLIVKELAVNAQSYYHYKIDDFYDLAFTCISDSRQCIREAAILSLRACLALSATREVDSSSPPWRNLYRQAEEYYESANQKDKFSRDDRTHCYILLVNELLRISSVSTLFDSFSPFYSIDNVYDEFLGDEYLCPPTHGYRLIIATLQLDSKTNTQRTPPYSENCQKFICKHYEKICSVVIRNLAAKSLQLSSAINNILPWLALFEPQTFLLNHLEPATDHLIGLTNDKDRASEAFHDLGLLILALKQDIIALPKPFVKSAVDAVWSKIRDSPRKTRDIELAVYKCMFYLLRSGFTGLETFKNNLIVQLETMSIKLSEGLILVLQEITDNDAKLKKVIQQHLLHQIFSILIHKPIHHPGLQRGTSFFENQYLHNSSVVNNSEEIILSLKTLSEFGFEDLIGISFHLKLVANTFLGNNDKRVRIQTIETLCNLLKQTIPSPSTPASIIAQQPSQQAATQNVSGILNLILKVGVTDQDSNVRLCVFRSLTSKFDGHLAQAENLQKIFAAFQDECFEIRLEVLEILGRLNIYNPAYLLPSLRKTLVQLLDDIRLTNTDQLQEQSTQLLACLITHAPILVKPYYEPILETLIPKLTDSRTPVGVTMSVLQAIAMQARVSQSEMKNYSRKITPILRDNVQDSANTSTDKTLMMLWTIGELLEHTRYVLEPYFQRPQMMDILFSFLKLELLPAVRLQSIRVLGLLGALDPHTYLAYHHKLKQDSQNQNSIENVSSDSLELQQSVLGNFTSEIWVSTSSDQLDDFYPQVAIRCLLRILNDTSLSTFHLEAAMSLPVILEYLDDKAPQFVKLILPTILPVIEINADTKLKTTLFSQLKRIIAIAGPQSKEFMPKIFEIIHKSWDTGVKRTALIELIKQLITTLGSEFRNYIPHLVQPMLGILLNDTSQGKQDTIELLKAIQACGPNIDDYLHMLLPPIIQIFDCPEYSIAVIKEALLAIDCLSSCIDFNDFVSPVVHSLSRAIENKEVKIEAFNVLISIIPQLGRSYEIFIPMVSTVLEKHGLYNTEYKYLIFQLSENKQVCSIQHPSEVRFLQHALAVNERVVDLQVHTKTPSNVKGSYMNILSLSKAWDTTDNLNVEAWNEWLRRFSMQLVQETPDKALRALHQICTCYNVLARELFNATFISCWSNLPLSHRDELIGSLEKALKVSKSPEIIQVILNLLEFTEHLEIHSLPLDIKILCESAFHSRAYAKALRYKEKEFGQNNITKDLLENLIDLNNKLQVPEASLGVLEYSKKLTGVLEDAKWYESLQCWDQALDIYRNHQYSGLENMHNTIGKLRCLEALGEWEELYDCSLEHWNKASTLDKVSISQIACSAAWGLNKWDKLNEFVELIPAHSQNGAYLRAVNCIHSEDYVNAKNYIKEARVLMDPELNVLFGESYTRAYNAMVFIQNLSELEEVIDVKTDPSEGKYKDLINTWWERLQGCHYNVEDWQRILLVRSLVINPTKDTRSWIKYSSLCRKSGRLTRARETLKLLGANQIESDRVDSYVDYAFIKFKWHTVTPFEDFHKRTLILDHMLAFTKKLICIKETNQRDPSLLKLLAKCFLRLGTWSWDLNKSLSESQIVKNILTYLQSATEYNSNSYKVWHAWAIFNFELANQQDNQSHVTSITSSSTIQSGDAHLDNVKNSIEGFFKSISLSNNSLQDSLRLLTLWFRYAGHDYIFDILDHGIRTVSIDTWLHVIPQLIARIDSPYHNVKKLIHHLLCDVGKQHPQALVYPITVASKSVVKTRSDAARTILSVISETRKELVIQALLVSEELIRVAILWHELWHEGLEEASRLYFADKNIPGMLNTLEPLHSMLEFGPHTLNEMSFSQAYGRDLSDAQDWCRKYQSTQSNKDLTQAWELYFHVFKRISKQLPLLVSLELKSVSHKLNDQRDMVLPVPGTYEPGQSMIYIQEFQPILKVIPSKQRPRKLNLRGSNGQEFQFLLKGHEDLRQDERVMQLFGLVNTLLLHNSVTFKKELFIQRYSVIPLSPNSGLIGWVPNCDTMHALIRDYRDKKNIVLNIEHRLMLKYSPDYECLPLIQKVEVFQKALEESDGHDLANILWLKSPSSEFWFARRTNYTRSLSVMSMVGYILGLGDRHPSNLMLDRISGRVLHIDFGDCFEVAMIREKFPEKIPFRLTRMLVLAMEITGIDGTFKHTCTSVMNVLRNNKESVMAVLEAFVYDPLLSWRLVDTNTHKKRDSKQSNRPLPHLDTNSQLIDDIILLQKRPSNMVSQPTIMEEDLEFPQMEVNEKALVIKSRIKDKLNGCDFSCKSTLSVEDQVELLINQATSHENLCQCYIGWCPFW